MNPLYPVMNNKHMCTCCGNILPAGSFLFKKRYCLIAVFLLRGNFDEDFLSRPMIDQIYVTQLIEKMKHFFIKKK